MPGLAEHLLDQVDADLERVPALSDLTSRQLLALLRRSQTVLRALHAHEILMGMLTDTGRNRMTGASVALRVLAEAREDGLSDRAILSASPVVLALTPPRVAPSPELPAEASTMSLGSSTENSNDNGILREALRLRVRWIQELSGRAAWALGERLAASDGLPRPGLIRHMSLDHVEAVVTKKAEVVPALVATHDHDFGAPLPAWFQVSDTGKPVRVQAAAEVGGGTGAGGGDGLRARSPTTPTTRPPARCWSPPRSRPGWPRCCPGWPASWPRPARCCRTWRSWPGRTAWPTVVGYAGATSDLPEGAIVEVDGDTGKVTMSQEEDAP